MYLYIVNFIMIYYYLENVFIEIMLDNYFTYLTIIIIFMNSNFY